MVTFKKLVLAAFATLLVAGACTSITIPSIPPINFPSIPPINFPSIPPINIPGTSGGGINFPGVSIPPAANPCTLVTAAEVSQILGVGVTDTSNSATDCGFLTPAFAALSVSYDDTTDLTGPQFLLGNSAQQINVGGFPGLAGTAIGVPAVYVQKPASQLTVLGFLGGTDPNLLTKMQQIAAIAVTRMP
jgi:hypothetical protein